MEKVNGEQNESQKAEKNRFVKVSFSLTWGAAFM